MLKRIVDKKVEVFKQKFPDYQISKKTGSFYTRIGVSENKKKTKCTGRAVTKGTIAKLGTICEWTENKSRFVYLLSQQGKLMLSKANGNFRSVTLKDVRQETTELAEIFFIGKKYEWLKDYPNLYFYKFFQGFNSLSEAKKFLGFSFISDKAFTDLFGDDHFDYLMPLILAKDKKNVVRLYKNLCSETKDSLKDYIEMCQNNSLPIEIPAGLNKLEELHDSAMWEVNRKTMDFYSKEYRYDIKEDFTKTWKERGLVFKRLETPYDMYSQGIKQQHCIGTNYASSLGSYAFYSFEYKGKNYDMMLYPKGSVGQFYGRKNTPVPTELKDKIQKDIVLSFSLVDTNPDIKDYPMIKEMKSEARDFWVELQ